MHKTLRVLIVTLAAHGLVVFSASAQEAEKPENLIKGDLDHGFIFSIDDKLSTIDGDFANFTGAHLGWLINHKLLIAVAGYGTSTEPNGLDMGYGGLLVEYFFDPNKLFNYSVRSLIGGGGADSYGRHGHGHGVDLDGFFVAEPEARVTLNVMGPFRMGFGVGYRFVGGGPDDFGLGGPTFNISFKFGKF